MSGMIELGLIKRWNVSKKSLANLKILPSGRNPKKPKSSVANARDSRAKSTRWMPPRVR
ncbi:MAG: hypothetical protein RLY56_1701 [Pseudomonadota bacterium]